MKAPFHRRVTLEQLAMFTEQLGILTTAGLGLIPALKILRNQMEKSALRLPVDAMIAGLYSGELLHEILVIFPHIFNGTYIAMVRVGEMSGQLGEMLLRHGRSLARLGKIQGRLTTLLAYPFVVIIAALFVIFFMGRKIIPQFQSFSSGAASDASLPFLTEMVMGFAQHFVPILTLAFLTPLLVFIYFKEHSRKFRWLLAKLVLKLPTIGRLISRQNQAIFGQNLAILLASNVPFFDAFSAAESAIGNIFLRHLFDGMLARISGGENFATLCKMGEHIDPIFGTFVEIGESTGKLAEMMARASSILSDFVEAKVARLLALVEPFSVIFLAGLVGLIAAAIFLPLVQMLQVVNF